jgi:hypothetical protein
MARARPLVWFAALCVVALAAWALQARATSKAVGPGCTFEGHKLFGKIQVVDAFPDVKVMVVSAFPDLKVKMVSAFPDHCGEWQPVDSFPDTKVKFVDAFPDVKIQVVDAFPGVP